VTLAIKLPLCDIGGYVSLVLFLPGDVELPHGQLHFDL
jgi:hypothetical protein